MGPMKKWAAAHKKASTSWFVSLSYFVAAISGLAVICFLLIGLVVAIALISILLNDEERTT